MANNVHAMYFDITDAGMLKLKSEYNATGNSNYLLPQAIILPDTVKDIAVSSLQQNMFKDNQQIISVVLPSAVKSIPNGFCRGAHNLAAIENISNITSIGTYAFYQSALTKCTFENLTTAGASAFQCCSELKSLDVPKLKEFPTNFLYACVELETVNAPVCTKIQKLSLFYTPRLNTFNHSTLTYVGLYAVQNSGYRITDGERAVCKGSDQVSLWMNSDFVQLWKTLCNQRLKDTGCITNPLLYSYSQEDAAWSENSSADKVDIAWFNWGDYNPMTKKYEEYIPGFDYNNYFDEEYAGELATNVKYKATQLDTSYGCTLHTLLGAYLGLYKPFGDTVVQNPKQIQDYVVKITGGRDTDGIPKVVKAWAASEPVYNDITKCTHIWNYAYKGNLARFKYVPMPANTSYPQNYPALMFNTTYLTTFIGEQIGIKSEVLGFNHSDYHRTADITSTENEIYKYVSDKLNWESYLVYIIEMLKEGNYVFLSGPGGGGGSNTHVSLIYGIDAEGYVYVNNTYTFKYQENEYDSLAARIPFENLFHFCASTAQAEDGTFTESPNVGTYPLIILKKKDFDTQLSNSFIQNCESMLNDKEGVVEQFDGISDPCGLTSDNINWATMQEFVDTLSHIRTLETTQTDRDLESRKAMQSIV